jgi:hypothetical protein
MSNMIIRMSWVFVATLLVVGGASVARADDDHIIVKVPFAFIVGDVHLPAGEYLVKELSEEPSVVSIVNSDGRESAITPTIPVSTGSSPVRPELMFEKFGGQYFLARVILDDDDAREIILTPARMERQLFAAHS